MAYEGENSEATRCSNLFSHYFPLEPSLLGGEVCIEC